MQKLNKSISIYTNRSNLTRTSPDLNYACKPNGYKMFSKILYDHFYHQKCFVESTLFWAQIFARHKTFSAAHEIIKNLSDASRPPISVNSDNINKMIT